jgi:hypothetical protein
MLKVALLLGGALLLEFALRRRAFQDFAAWLLALAVASTLLAIEALPFLLPLLPKILPVGLLAALQDLFSGGQP